MLNFLNITAGVRNILPSPPRNRGKRGGPEPEIIVTAPISQVVQALLARQRVIRNLVLRIAVASQRIHRHLKQVGILEFVLGKLSDSELPKKLGVFFVG